MPQKLLTVVIGTLVVGGSVHAHHAFASYYFEDQSVTISGTVREFQFVNPHAILLVDAKDQEGRLETYSAEFASPRRLAGEGVTKETLKPGDFVIVTGSPGRVASEHTLHLKSVQRPSDGRSWGGGRRR